MQDQNTILPASVLVSLYKDSLVLPETEKKTDLISKDIAEIAAAPETASPAEQKNIKSKGPLKHLGDHHKKITVIVNDPHSVYLNETDFILLTSILNACKLTIADIALVNIGNQDTSLHQILETLPSNLVMCFDIKSVDLKIKLPDVLYKINELGETRIFFSKGLSSMQGTGLAAKQEKGTLWILLKKIFAL